MNILVALLSGVIFGIGLIAAEMNDPAKVLGFLDISGQWDPSLGLVMVSAIGISAPAFVWARKKKTSILGMPMQLPPRQSIDAPLLLGSAIFGIGWGISGFCPGPGLLSIGAGYLPGIAFAITMPFGMEIHDWLIDAGIIAAGDS
jgi:uncharacterized membrane protein YedE/YeeE